MTTAGREAGSICVRLPSGTGVAKHYLRPAVAWPSPTGPITSRHAYAATHVIPRAQAENVPGAPPDLDWDATLAARHRIWDSGLGVAEAMDTAQRGLGLDWPTAAELARRSAHAAHEVGGDIAAGAGTDHLDLRTVGPGSAGRAAVRDAYRMQLHAIGDTGATPIVMASRALVVAATSADDYLEVYDDLLSDADAPVILHWLGPMFDAALTGYWGSEDLDEATTTFMTIVARHASKVAGVKVSLLDRDREIAMRGALPPGVRMYTGDDFNYPDLIVGDETGHSDALLGVFAAIHPAASAALQALDRGDSPHARAILDSTVALGRHLFEAPTSHYKTGIAFLSWLNGYQSGFTMLAGTHSSRSMSHLSRVLVLADEAGLLTDPELAALRMERLLTVHGVLA